MSYMGKVRPTVALTSSDIEDNAVTSSKIIADAVTTAKINDGDVTTAKMATDPTNASNLSSGSVPLAQLGNVDTSGITANADDIALLGFKVASNGSLAKYNLVDQTVDDFQDTSGVDASASTNEVRDASGKYYSGTVASVINSYTTSVRGTALTTTHTGLRAANAEILVVAGAGSGAGNQGASNASGGGGAGGIVHHATYPIVADVVYDLTIGEGGAASGYGGDAGGNSIWNINSEGSQSTMTAVGGGRGGYNGQAGGDGGSGGGSGGSASTGGSGTQGDSGGGTGYGNDGGGGTTDQGDGGGGANAAGGDGPTGTGGTGGAGKLFSTFVAYGTTSGNVASTGSDGGYFGGGGGGGGTTTAGVGGVGGGGAGATASGQPPDALNDTGGGAGGAEVEQGNRGSDGIILISYPEVGNNMTLVSTTTAAQAAPTKGDIVLTYTNGAGTTTLDTDLTAEISADGGSTWTALALGSEGSTGAHNIATSHDVTISSTITAPYNMAYRIKTLNQSASKSTRIQAVSLGWS